MYENCCDKISESFDSPIETRFSFERITKYRGMLAQASIPFGY